MKKILYKIFLLSLFFIMITCVNDTPIYSVSGVVFNVLSDDYSPGLKEGVPVVIDNQTVISNERGEFYFSSISQGEHTISASFTGYETYTEKIKIENDLYIPIYLFGVKDDYFPISNNYIRKFKYDSYAATHIDGEAFWKVYSSATKNDTIIYVIEETLIYENLRFNGELINEADTAISYFEIREVQSKKIIIKSNSWSFSFNRYQYSISGEIVNLNPPGSPTIRVSLKRDVGLYKLKATYGSGNTREYNLIE